MQTINNLSRIKILPLQEAQKIAAGEVVERPANIIKELIENALDAGATAITLYIEEGGKQLIRIVDNGTGMSVEDARLCCAPHATSKITHVEELPTITTFGFRGEALASIASVSTLHLITKHQALDQATKLTLQGGIITDESTAAANTGTDITIRDLFYNVPARKKFLKTAATEWHAIAQLVTACAFDYPHVQFNVYHNQHLTITCAPVTDILGRAEQLFDSVVVQRLLKLEHHDAAQKITVTGVISDQHTHRYDRSQIYLLVNRRWVKNHKLLSAIMRGYQGVLPAARYPYAVLSITVPSETVDINIHPKKEEVAFLHPRLVELAIEKAIAALLQGMVVTQLTGQSSTILDAATTSYVPAHSWQPLEQKSFSPSYAPTTLTKATAPTIQMPLDRQADALPLVQEKQATLLAEQQQTVATAQENFQVIGQLKQTYILIETQTGLMIIDQHAAHERILYEEIGAKLSNPESIQLLFPTIITVPRDCSFTTEHQTLLQTFGIEAEAWDGNQVRVSATPVYIKPHMLEDILGELVQTQEPKKVTHKLQAMIACKAAVKAHDVLNIAEMEMLVERLLACPQRLSCPHGRPTSWLINEYELERTFKRIV